MPAVLTTPTNTELKRWTLLMSLSKQQYALAAGMVLFALTVVMVINDSVLTVGTPTGAIQVRSSSRFHSTNKAVDRNIIRQATQQAKELFLQRQEAYQRASRNSTAMTLTMQGRPLDETNVRDTWRMRGIGYAYARHAVIFAALLPDEPVSPGWNVIRVYNTVEITPADCDKWTIYVRVNGPEIFAGTALPVASRLFPGQSCHWELPIYLQEAGDYEVDVRLLIYNGHAPPQGDTIRGLCETRQDFDIPLDEHPYSTGFLGFKFYSPMESCCEICTREPLCKYWVSPPLSVTPGQSRWGGCELFFDEPVDSSDHDLLTRQLRRRYLAENVHIPANESKLHPHFRTVKNMTGIDYFRGLPKVYHGKPHHVETSYFLGCGWSFWHTQTYPCLDSSLDDAVQVYPSSRFALAVAAKSTEHDKSVSKRQCFLDDEYPKDRFSMMTETGRWVRYPWPSEIECPQSMQADPNFTMFDITQFDGDNPTCWFRDDLSNIGKRCMEYCAHKEHYVPWRSSIKMETEHYSKWENYDCDFVELTNDQLQQCVDGRRIGSYIVQGASISVYVKEFLDLRFQHIRLYDPPGSVELLDNQTQPLTITVSTFKIPHLLWHLNSSQWRDELETAPVVGENEERYFLTGYYYSSEREPWVTVDHADSISKLMQEILVPKGWRMLNGFDVSAAFTYEVATQEDGLHMIAGPVKMVITKLLHYMCQDYLNKGIPAQAR